MKLLCHDNIQKSHMDVSKPAAVAIVDVCLMLSFEPRRQATSTMEVDLIASHMRHVFSIPKHRQYKHSGYPSEPTIAEAAVEQSIGVVKILTHFKIFSGRISTLDYSAMVN
jgi:hypothetical protein